MTARGWEEAEKLAAELDAVTAGLETREADGGLACEAPQAAFIEELLLRRGEILSRLREVSAEAGGPGSEAVADSLRRALRSDERMRAALRAARESYREELGRLHQANVLLEALRAEAPVAPRLNCRG